MEPDALSDAQDAAPGVLTDLIAAGLVSHEMIGDPARLGGETSCLQALCAVIAGPVWRIEAYHYAFQAGPDDLDGDLADLAPGQWTAALQAALAERLGEEAVWLNATDLLPEAGRSFDRPLLLLQAHAEAVRTGLESAGAGLQAVIDARYATACARLASDPETDGPLAARLGAIEARLDAILARLEQPAGPDPTLARLGETLTTVLQRLDAQADILHGHIAREDRVADNLAEIGAVAARPEAFQETLGVTLAEFLARIERQAEEGRAGTPAPQVN